MKSYFLFSFAGLFFYLLILSRACTPQHSGNDQNYQTDCFADRQTMDEIDATTGVVTKVGQEFILIVDTDTQIRYLACNLENEFKIDQLKVVFGGKVKEIFPNERWPATPFVLTFIRRK